MNRAYESAAREAQEIMAQAYEREEAARAEVFPHGGESDRRSGEKTVFSRGGESDPSGGETAVFPHEGESEGRAVGAEDIPDEGENGEVFPEEVEEAEDFDAYVTDRALEELGHRFPQMDLTELAQNPLFIRFAAGEGRDFRAICENFDAFIDQARALVRSAARPDRRTSSAAPVRRVPLSNIQRRELAAWNAANPAYRMSERDYFSRLRG